MIKEGEAWAITKYQELPKCPLSSPVAEAYRHKAHPGLLVPYFGDVQKHPLKHEIGDDAHQHHSLASRLSSFQSFAELGDAKRITLAIQAQDSSVAFREEDSRGVHQDHWTPLHALKS